MQYLTGLDWFWILLFVVLMIGTGIAFSRLARRSEADFFLAGRKLPWWLPATSVYATHTGTDTPIYVTGLVFMYGVSGLWYMVFPIWVGISAFTSTRIFRRSLAYTIAEWQNLRFGGLGSEMLRGWFAGWQFFMSMFVLGWVGAAMGKIGLFLFDWPTWLGVILFSSICAVYVLTAGYWGVIMADFQQGIIVFLLILMVSIWCLLAAGGPAAIYEKIEAMNSTHIWTVPSGTAETGQAYLRVNGVGPDGQTLSATTGPLTIRAAGAKVDQPVAASYDDMFRKNGGLGLVFPEAGSVLVAGEKYKIVWEGSADLANVTLDWSEDGGAGWKPVADQVRNGQLWRLSPFSFTGWFSGDFPLFWFFTMIIMSTIGGFGIGTNSDWFVGAQRMQSARTVQEASTLMLVGAISILFRNGVWIAAALGLFTLVPHFVNVSDVELNWYTSGIQYMPAGMVGLFAAGIIAIHLSTVSTRLNLGAMYFTRDLYHHYLRPKASERELVWAGTGSTVALLLGSFLYAMMITEITQWLVFAMWIMFAGVWLPSILQVVWWRFNAWGYLTAWVSSLMLSWLVVWVLPGFGLIPSLPDYLQFWVLLLLGAAIFLPVTLLTRAENMDHLVRFYVKTRPIGWWGPVRREAVRRGLVETA